jgi:hypothetical protein
MSTQRGATYRWLPDDTEESIVGAEWHQDTISSLCNCGRCSNGSAARTAARPRRIGSPRSIPEKGSL